MDETTLERTNFIWDAIDQDLASERCHPTAICISAIARR